MLTIYLAGGMRSGWQDIIIEQVASAALILDPRKNGTTMPPEYTAYDLAAIRKADIVFAYLEKSNPSGFGMAAEIGYARALGKLIIFVNEQADNKYTTFLEQTADLYCANFGDGLRQLYTVTAFLAGNKISAYLEGRGSAGI